MVFVKRGCGNQNAAGDQSKAVVFIITTISSDGVRKLICLRHGSGAVATREV